MKQEAHCPLTLTLRFAICAVIEEESDVIAFYLVHSYHTLWALCRAGIPDVYAADCPGIYFGTNIARNGSNYANAYFEIPAIRTYTIEAGVAASASASATPQTMGSASGSVAAGGANQTQVMMTGGAGRTIHVSLVRICSCM
ncbi:hypothetical protein B0H14DRAFT_3875494 [Mycena olivaceomarginata]|nr:hypothetical protein B0H14DRAFT_3875494 [Mycena olivaceomarginata]